MTVTAFYWTMEKPIFARKQYPTLCCASIFAVRFYPPKKDFTQRFSVSVLIAGRNVVRYLCQIPTDRNTVPLAANGSIESRKLRASADEEVDSSALKKPDKSRFSVTDLIRCICYYSCL